MKKNVYEFALMVAAAAVVEATTTLGNGMCTYILPKCVSTLNEIASEMKVKQTQRGKRAFHKN
jgi:hypothetical protein